MTDISDKPAIYVGSYRRYNEGSLFGKWFLLEDYIDASGFWEAVNEFHAAEIQEHGDIEPMFQDWQCIPSSFIGESHLDPDLWPGWLDLDDDDRELLDVYLEHVNQNGNLEEARVSFAGKFSSEVDWAENFLEDTGQLQEIPERLRYYFDYDSYARDARLGGDMVFVEHGCETWAFYNN